MAATTTEKKGNQKTPYGSTILLKTNKSEMLIFSASTMLLKERDLSSLPPL